MEIFRLREVAPEVLAASSLAAVTAIRALVPEADVQEAGSTAVPGAIGKQDIDIVVRVNAGQFPSARSVLDASYQRNPLQPSTPDFQSYTVSADPDISVQLTVKDSPFDCFHRFLEALRSDAALLARYNDLKRHWNGRPMEDYRKAKAGFIEDALRKPHSTQER
jgi:GrpB-like predicted nucleotidyltransferase (UPF0157 family)